LKPQNLKKLNLSGVTIDLDEEMTENERPLHEMKPVFIRAQNENSVK
jgi:hypothetical protein